MSMDNKNGRFIIITGFIEGSDTPIADSVRIGESDFVVCADSGYRYAEREGIGPDLIIGDFDSGNAADAGKLGVEVIAVDPVKDDTDTLLCIKRGMGMGYRKFVIVGGIGGSYYHTEANIQNLSFMTDLELDAEISTPRETIFMLDGKKVKIGAEYSIAEVGEEGVTVIAGSPGDKFSVFSFTERCTGVFIKGAKYELDDYVLTQSYAIGAGNEIAAGVSEAVVRVGVGRLLLVAEKN
jgi:thiamine pyrophosphokinase